MIKALKGAYAAATQYSKGDVVSEGGNYYVLFAATATGVHPCTGKDWNLVCNPDVIDALNIASGLMDSMNTLNPNAKELVLASSTASSTKKYKITVVDTGGGTLQATEIS